MSFHLESAYKPTGDQPEAIRQLVDGVNGGDRAQVLLGVTGSGKTFTMANVIKELNRPTLILTHNKTLTAQLYGEFREFFPDNAVEYFVSYYDYYQPEAYIAVTDTFIEKDLQINEEVDKLRLRATSSLLSGRNDVIIVASVSCIYGMGNPDDYKNSIIRLQRGQIISRNAFLYKLVDSLYARTEAMLTRGHFRVKGDTVDIALPYVEHGLRIHFYGDEIEEIELILQSGAISIPVRQVTADDEFIRLQFDENIQLSRRRELVRVVLARADAWINPPRPQDNPFRSFATILRCVFELFWLTWKTRRNQRRQPVAANHAQEDGTL